MDYYVDAIDFPMSEEGAFDYPADPIPDVLFQHIERSPVRGLRGRLAGNRTEGTASRGFKSAQKSDERNRKRAKTVRKVRTTQQKGAVA